MKSFRSFDLLNGLLLGLLSGILVIICFFAGHQAVGLPFVPFDLFDFVARVLPGVIITFGIDSIVAVITSLNLGSVAQSAKLAEMTFALLQFALVGLVFGFVLTLLGRAEKMRAQWWGLGLGLLAAFGMMAVAAYLEHLSVLNAFWILLLFAMWGFGLGWLIQNMIFQRLQRSEPVASRRTFFYLLASSVGALLVTVFGTSMFYRRISVSVAQTGNRIPDPELTSGPAASPSAQELAQRIDPAPRTRPEVTSNADFYRIDINLMPKVIPEESWRLTIDGLVDRPLSLSLQDIHSRPSVSQYITLTCISNRIGGDLIGTTLWTGVRLQAILREAGLKPAAKAVAIESGDGFYESVAMTDIMDERTLLVYAMNNEPLPTEHGFPLRIYIPNRYGMKQPKWITHIEATADKKPGYWVDRGWSKEAFVRTTSVIDAVTVENQNRTIPIGGIAFAGARGISKVEIQIDDEPWCQAELRKPPLSPLTWVQWRYDWQQQPGKHVARVRAYDGNSELQILEKNTPHPEGATGIHTYSFRA